jgi:hypothetical protein
VNVIGTVLTTPPAKKAGFLEPNRLKTSGTKSAFYVIFRNVTCRFIRSVSSG